MTAADAQQITRQADDLAEIHPTHGIAGDLRAARRSLRYAARKARDDAREPLSLSAVEAAFAAMFGEA